MAKSTSFFDVVPQSYWPASRVESEAVLRRLFSLSYAGWVPHDHLSSWADLDLMTGVDH
jgi:hypothetical protein